MRMPKVGERAPDFELRDQNGGTVRLSALLATGPVVIFFYPKDDTPGCTKRPAASATTSRASARPARRSWASVRTPNDHTSSSPRNTRCLTRC